MTPWQKIMKAAERGKGVRLTEEDVWRMSQDDAIQRVAERDDEEADLLEDGKRWTLRKRAPGDGNAG